MTRISQLSNQLTIPVKTPRILTAVLLAHCSAMSACLGGSLPPETRQSVAEWRAANLPAADTASYWASLKKLGSRIGEDHARKIGETGASDIDSAVAWMAFHVWKAPQKVDELAGWYGRRVNEIPLVTWNEMTARLEAQGLSREDIHRALSHGWNPSKRYQAPVIPLIAAQHGKPEYLAAWQGWLLAPNSMEQRTMSPRTDEALVSLKGDGSIILLVERLRLMPLELQGRVEGDAMRDGLRKESARVRRLIRNIGGWQAVLGLLECCRLAEQDGYLGEGRRSLRGFVIGELSSRYLIAILEETNPEYLAHIRIPGKSLDDPDSVPPFDDKWKQFRPIIQAMLGKPEGLRPEDMEILREALAAMPKE